MKKIFIMTLIITVILHACKKSESNSNSISGNKAAIQLDSINNVSYTSAVAYVTITSQGSSAITVKGVCYSIASSPKITNNVEMAIGSGNSFTVSLTGLTANTTYYARAFAINSTDTIYSNEKTFKTISQTLPIVSSITATGVKQTTAIAGGNITSDGGSNITARGICWSLSPNPTTADNKLSAGIGTGSYTGAATALTYSTTYYLRAYAINSLGTAYGSQITFTTQPISVAGAGVKDVDGNNYATVILADKEWMAENLKVTKYSNGDVIFNAVTYKTWDSMSDLSKGVWSYYTNTAGLNNLYGKLYSGYAISDSRNVCPSGWHVPTIGEWGALTSYIGNTSTAGGNLKEDGVSNWQSPNTGATNISKFTARPGGYKASYNPFYNQGQSGVWWTSDAYNCIKLNYNTSTVETNAYGIASGLSVRCLKN